MGLEQGPLSLMSTVEELLRKESSDPGLENCEYTLYPQKLALTSPTSSSHPVSIVRSRTKALELLLLFIMITTKDCHVWPKHTVEVCTQRRRIE
jgi:hypothetical protein